MNVSDRIEKAKNIADALSKDVYKRQVMIYHIISLSSCIVFNNFIVDE